jgi:hypothetical protein
VGRVIGFYIPARFKKRVVWVPHEQRGKVIVIRNDLMKSPLEPISARAAIHAGQAAQSIPSGGEGSGGNHTVVCLEPHGHASVQTTERYLGTEQNLSIAVNDGLGLEMD